MYDVITIGDSATDVFLEIDDSSPLVKINRKTGQLNLKYASKIPVKSKHKVVGTGGAANHVIGASRLGLKTAIYTIVGDDDCGHGIKDKLRREKVATNYVVVDKKSKSNYSAVIDYKGDRTILVFHERREYHLPLLTKTRWIYFSSIDGNHKEFNKELCDYVKKNKIKLGFNPGSRQMALGAGKLKTILLITDVLFVNKQEAQRLSRKTEDIKVLLKALSKKGPKMVVITDGRKGSYCYDGEKMYEIGIIDLPVVERTGSGDAYASAFLAALNYGHDVKEAMRWGSLNGTYAAVQMGPHLGLLSKKEMEKFLKKYKTFQPRILL